MKLYELVGHDGKQGFSPFVWRVKMALAHKGFDYETVPLHFTDIADAVAFADTKTVPVLVDGDNIITDSWDICCYLEDTYPDRPLIFESRVAAKLFNFQMGMPMLAPLFKTIVADIHDIIHDKDKDYFRTTREARIGCTLEEAEEDHQTSLMNFQAGLLPYNQFLKHHEFLGGIEPVYQDFALYSMFLWARATSSKKILGDDDPVHDWIDRMDQVANGAGGRVKRIEK